MGHLLMWDEIGQRLYETGVKKAVIYPWDKALNGGKGGYGKGVAWNGITAITENAEGAEANAQYADDIKYLNLISNEEFGVTIEAFTYPDEFAQCDGSSEVADGVFIGQQSRLAFGLAYRTTLGNDTEDNEYGYKLHLVYGCKAAPTEKNFQTINDSPEAITFSWEVSTVPVEVEGFKPTSVVTIDSTKCPADKLAELEDILYGKTAEGAGQPTPARLPLPAEVVTIVGKTQG